jgi:hypothetical protein
MKMKLIATKNMSNAMNNDISTGMDSRLATTENKVTPSDGRTMANSI